MRTIAATIYCALILLFGQQTVYQFVRLFYCFLSNGNKITNVLDS